MSTRSTIKYNRPGPSAAADGPGYHLFHDYDDRADGYPLPVHLELFGVEAEMTTAGYVHIILTDEMARELGLLP